MRQMSQPGSSRLTKSKSCCQVPVSAMAWAFSPATADRPASKTSVSHEASRAPFTPSRRCAANRAAGLAGSSGGGSSGGAFSTGGVSSSDGVSIGGGSAVAPGALNRSSGVLTSQRPTAAVVGKNLCGGNRRCPHEPPVPCCWRANSTRPSL